MKNTIYTKQSGRFAMPQFQMLGVILFIIGIVYAFQLNPLSILLLLVGIALATMTTGVQIDFEKRKHREYFSMLGFKRGKWVDIPTLEYVSIYLERYAQNMWVASIGATDNFKDFKVGLIVSKTLLFDAGGYDNKVKAFKAAKNIAKKLGSKLFDYTSSNPEWINIA